MKKFLSSVLVVAMLAMPVSMMSAFADEPTEAKEVASNFVLDENNEMSKAELKEIEIPKYVNKFLKDAEKNGAVLNVYDKEGKLVETIDLKKDKAKKNLTKAIKSTFFVGSLIIECLLVKKMVKEGMKEVFHNELHFEDGALYCVENVLDVEHPGKLLGKLGCFVGATIANYKIVYKLPSAVVDWILQK